jgi:hypothetical protein
MFVVKCCPFLGPTTAESMKLAKWWVNGVYIYITPSKTGRPLDFNQYEGMAEKGCQSSDPKKCYLNSSAFLIIPNYNFHAMNPQHWWVPRGNPMINPEYAIEYHIPSIIPL